MELQENSVIIDDKLDRMLEPELGGHFTHAYCTTGLCEVTFNGQVFTMHEGDCMIIIANRLVSRVVPSEDLTTSFSYHFESLYSKGVLSARRLKNLLKKDGLGKSISSDI